MNWSSRHFYFNRIRYTTTITRYGNLETSVIYSLCNVVQGRHERLFHIGAVGMHPSVPESAKPAAKCPHR